MCEWNLRYFFISALSEEKKHILIFRRRTNSDLLSHRIVDFRQKQKQPYFSKTIYDHLFTKIVDRIRKSQQYIFGHNWQIADENKTYRLLSAKNYRLNMEIKKNTTFLPKALTSAAKNKKTPLFSKRSEWVAWLTFSEK